MTLLTGDRGLNIVCACDKWTGSERCDDYLPEPEHCDGCVARRQVEAAEIDVARLARLRSAYADRNRLRGAVESWMAQEARLGYMRYNSDCQQWSEYLAAEDAWAATAAEILATEPKP